MRKMGLSALLLAVALFMGFGATTVSAEGMKCGAGKCGASMKQMNVSEGKSCGKANCKCGPECKCGDNCKCGDMKKITMDGGKAMTGKSCGKANCKCGPDCQCGDNCQCDSSKGAKKCGAGKKAATDK